MPKRVGGCTRSGDSYVRWYRGKTRYVCPVTVPDDQVEERWIKKKRKLDRELADEAVEVDADELLLRELVAMFVTEMDRRVETGKPKPLSPRMAHNYTVDCNEFGEVVGGSVRVADVGPDHFALYGRSIAHLKASGYDSKVAHVCALFNWAVRKEYVQRTRFGDFGRHAKRERRDQRISRTFAFSAEDVAKLIDGGGGTLRTMIMLGIAGGMNNSEIAWLERGCVDLEARTIDFRRRKTGKVRRVIPLPQEIADELRAYQRPDPRDEAHAELFFVTEAGLPYVRMTESGQANTITVLFKRLAEDLKVKKPDDGKGFKSLRTTFTNLAPAGYRDEIELLTGHAHGTVLLDSYLEGVGMDRLKHVVDSVWGQVSEHRANKSPSDASSAAAPCPPAS